VKVQKSVKIAMNFVREGREKDNAAMIVEEGKRSAEVESEEDMDEVEARKEDEKGNANRIASAKGDYR
jgi:hypothetical protein